MQSRATSDSSSGVWARALRLFLPVAAVCIVGALFIFFAEVETETTKLKLVDQSAVLSGAQAIEKVVEGVTQDVVYLSQSQGLRQLLDAKSDTDEYFIAYKALAQDWALLSRTHKKYDQIRWLDNTGQERLRVNLNQGKPIVVPVVKLQNKAKRYYFADTVVLKRGEFFISPFDLNMERGEIEKPLKPMIRIGTPVFDGSGKKRGIVLVNYLGDALLKEYQQMMGALSKRAWLINRNSYWLKASDPKMEWGFMFKNPQNRLSHYYPYVWAKIQKEETGQFETDDGLWTFTTLHPLRESHKTSDGANEAFAPSKTQLERGAYFWKAVMLLPRSEITATFWQTVLSLCAVTILLLLAFFYGCWRLAKAWVGEEEKEEELRQVNRGLEQRVADHTKDLREEIEMRKQAEAKLKHLATHDTLTGLPTRLLCREHIEKGIAAANRYEKKLAVLFIDLDGFKLVNDTMGHECGDEVLIEVARRLLNCVRAMDLVSRIGGDEFVVVLEDLEIPEDVEIVASKLLKALKKPFELDTGTTAQVGASIGIAVYENGNFNADELIHHADEAMYDVKNAGKNNYCFYCPQCEGR